MPGKMSPATFQRSYWLDQLGEPPATPDTPPRTVDVLVVGSGYTGLNAAIQTARGGASTLVIDAENPGFGCSTRNGGQVSTSVKPSLGKLAARYGMERAQAIRAEGRASLEWLGTFVEVEGLACDFKRAGRFHAAHTPRHYEALVRDAETMAREEGIESFAVPRAEQRSELGTDAYHGGVVFTQHCSIDPARYHRELLSRALATGAQIVGGCRALSIRKTAKGFSVSTSKGEVESLEVIVATNGYTTDLVPWIQRRVIPIGSYIIATEELPEGLVDELFPTDRIASDTCKVVYYYRTSPDRRRILFGGRVSARETDTKESGPRLYERLCRIFPQLQGKAISHSWSGIVAYSFDELPHTGVHEGIHYALGYCGSGVAMASYLGMRTGQKVLGLTEGKTAFDDVTPPTQPLYTGQPWFLPAAVAYYRWIDDWQWRRSARAA